MSADKVEARCHLAIVFCDISNSTQISSVLEPEIYSELLDKFTKIITEIVESDACSGTIIRIDGDGVIFVVGHPHIYEDMCLRAVNAAVALHEAITNLDQTVLPGGVKLSLHTGIHSGVVLLRTGSNVRGAYEILGQPTNVAARLCDFAATNEIIVSDRTLGTDRKFFDVNQSRHIKIRGQHKRIRVHNILRRAQLKNIAQAPIKISTSPFAGRDSYLSKLHQCLKDTESGNSQSAIIAAPAGIGKTRLINEFLDGATEMGYSVHRGYCQSSEGTKPLQPVEQLIKSILTAEYGVRQNINLAKRELDRVDINSAATSALTILLALGNSGGDEARPKTEEILNALSKLLRGIQGKRSLIFFVDDWQWVDRASERILQSLLSQEGCGIFFIRADRGPYLNSANFDHSGLIELAPLRDAEAYMLVQNLLIAPEPFAIEKIIRLAGGSPLFIEELCHSFQEDRRNAEDQRTARLEALIQSRFTRLPKHQTKLIETASVIGYMIPTWLFHDITGIDPGHDAFSALSQNDFIYSGDISGVLRFKHEIARDVIYGMVNLHERKAIHGRIVDALHRYAKDESKDENYEALAYHYDKCGESERSCHYAILAGDKALSASALDLAQKQYRHALQNIVSLPLGEFTDKTENSLVTKFGLAAILDPSWEQVSVLETAAKRAVIRQDLAGQATAEYWLGFILYGLGEPKLAIPHMETAQSAAMDCGNERISNQVQANLGQAYAASGKYDLAVKYLDADIAQARAKPLKTKTSLGLSYTIACKAFLLADQGHFERSHACFDEALNMLSGKEHHLSLSIINLRSAAYIWEGDYEKAQSFADKVLDLSMRMRSRYHNAMARALKAAAQIYETANLENLDTLEDVTRWLTESSTQQFVSLNYGYLTDIYAYAGNVKMARHYAAKTLLRARKGDRLGEAMAYRALGRLAQNSRNDISAQKYFKLARRSATDRQSPRETLLTDVSESQGRDENPAPESGRSRLEKISDMGLRIDAFARLATN